MGRCAWLALFLAATDREKRGGYWRVRGEPLVPRRYCAPARLACISSRTVCWPRIVDSLPATVAIECGLLVLGLMLYLRASRAKDRIGVYGLWSLMVVLVAGWVSSLFGPPPPSERVLAYSALAMWLAVPWAAWVDRHRGIRPASH